MYLACVTINFAHPRMMKALANPYLLHQWVWSAFPDRADGGAGRILYRLEQRRENKSLRLLVLSEHMPNHARWSADHLALDVQARPYQPQYTVGDRLIFRLRANPTKRLPAHREDKLAGKRVQLLTEVQQQAWLVQHAARLGFQVGACRISGTERMVCHKVKDGPQLVHQAVTFDGILTVTDPALFRQALEGGIGSGKGFGFGLLSVARR